MDTQRLPSRLPFLDGLRVAAFLLLIPYHVGMYYVSWDWHVKSPAASHALEPFMLMLALGHALPEAVRAGHAYVRAALTAAAQVRTGHGSGPLNHGAAPRPMQLISL